MAMAAGATDILCVGVNEYAAHQNLVCPENNASLIGELHRARGHSVALLLGKEATVEQVRLKWVRAGRDLADERMIPYVRTGVTKESGGWQKPVLGYI